jgi:hypothetical protein
MGNPAGKVTLVEFTDFACTYCRRSVGDVDALIAANPDLKVVVRELPIIAPASEPAARMGLAAAAQGKYAAFHKAMFAGDAPAMPASPPPPVPPGSMWPRPAASRAMPGSIRKSSATWAWRGSLASTAPRRG